MALLSGRCICVFACPCTCICACACVFVCVYVCDVCLSIYETLNTDRESSIDRESSLTLDLLLKSIANIMPLAV